VLRSILGEGVIELTIQVDMPIPATINNFLLPNLSIVKKGIKHPIALSVNTLAPNTLDKSADNPIVRNS
jgi:hypothetical protein